MGRKLQIHLGAYKEFLRLTLKDQGRKTGPVFTQKAKVLMKSNREQQPEYSKPLWWRRLA
jgi:hypothetical protein